MEIKRERSKGKLFLTQKDYIEKVVKRFSLHEAKLVSLSFIWKCEVIN